MEHKVDCWLVNTGWTGGPYGVGSRISIRYTRALLNAALTGGLKNVKYIKDPVFGFDVPQACEGVPEEILNPANSWKDKDQYMDVLGSLGWELVLVGIPFMIYSALSGGIRRFVGVYLALHAVVWLSTGCVLRFLTVTVGLAAILAADGIIKYWREAPRYARIMLASGLVLFAGARLLSYAYVQNVFEIPSVLTSVRTPRQYLSSRLSYYPCAEAAGKLTPPDSRILLAGEMRSYYFGRIVWPTSIFRPNEFVAMANASSGYEDYRQKLLAFGYTHGNGHCHYALRNFAGT